MGKLFGDIIKGFMGHFLCSHCLMLDLQIGRFIRIPGPGPNSICFHHVGSLWSHVLYVVTQQCVTLSSHYCYKKLFLFQFPPPKKSHFSPKNLLLFKKVASYSWDSHPIKLIYFFFGGGGSRIFWFVLMLCGCVAYLQQNDWLFLIPHPWLVCSFPPD